MADDERNQTEDQNPPEEQLEQDAASRVTELEGLVAQKDEELTEVNTQILELEQTVANLDSEVVNLKQSLNEAVTSYKTMVVQANPDVPEEFISGDTIESIEGSLMEAKTLVGKVRQGLEAEIVSIKVPTGAPQRTLPDLSSLSPREKIQYAIGGKK